MSINSIEDIDECINYFKRRIRIIETEGVNGVGKLKLSTRKCEAAIEAFERLKNNAVTVQDVVSLCEYVSCDVYNQLGEKVEITKENVGEEYAKAVESIRASGNIVKIYNFDKLDEVESW